MTAHAEDALRSASIAQILDLPLAVPTSETSRAERLVSSQDSQVLDLVVARATTVCAVVADETTIAEQKQVRVRVQKSSACVAPEAVNVPSVARCILTVSIVQIVPFHHTAHANFSDCHCK